MAVIKSNSITFIDNAGVERYLYIRYSNDGETFTENNGTTPGEWLGICSSNSPIAPTDFSAYTWNKVQGNDGKTLYTWIKYADDINGTNMSDNPNGKIYMGIAYNKETSTESENPEDYVWSLIASRGIDRIEEWYATTENDTDTPVFGENPGEIPKLSSRNKYLWNKEITYFTDGDTDETEPVIIGAYGDSGIGIKDIENYYTTTKEIDEELAFPDTPNEPPKVDSENKYLWNYEKIIYTDNTYKSTEPAIIGVYGDEGDVGADAIAFKIYSTKGFEFIDSVEESEKIETITLQTMSFKGIEQLTNVTYQWFYLNENDEEIDLDGKTDSSLEVNIKDEYAFFNLGCKMYYEENIYRDYRTLSKKTDVYIAVIKFFDGNNIFEKGQEFVAGYVQLYKNNTIAEDIKTTSYYYGKEVTVSDGIISSNINMTGITDGTSMYFIYIVDDKPRIVLGKYNGTVWNVEDIHTKYIYESNINANIYSNTFIVSKLDVARSLDINIDIFTSTLTTEDGLIIPDDETLIAMTKTTIIDLNDTVVSNTEPENPVDGQSWFNTKTNTLMICDTSIFPPWRPASEQYSGETIYTSQPTSYKKGDLWIVEDTRIVVSYDVAEVTSESSGTYWIYTVENENYIYQEVVLPDAYDSNITYYNKIETVEEQIVVTDSGSYGPGAILKATESSSEFNADHWIDAIPSLSKMQNNIEQYFTFSTQNGLKIGQTDEKFYVNINAKKMGFHEIDDDGIDNEVVYISGKSANITNIVVEESANFECGVSVNNEINIYNTNDEAERTGGGFTWKIEPDGTFSLIKIGGAN